MPSQHERALLPPLPGGTQDFPEDEMFVGTSPAQDRALVNLHKDGWSLTRLFSSPNAVLPLPTPQFPAGRVYLFSDNVALVVDQATSRIIASLPARAAMRTLDDSTPEVLEEDGWASEYWERTEDTAIDVQKRWYKQSFHAVDGSRYTIRRNPEGTADIVKDGAILHAGVRSGDEADELDLEPAIAELVDYILEN